MAAAVSVRAVPSPGSRRGLYDPSFEHDACGMGLVANLHGTASHGLVDQSLTVLERHHHRLRIDCVVGVPPERLAASGLDVRLGCPAPAGHVVAGVEADALKPGTDVGFGAETRSRLQGSNRGFLHDVLRIGFVSQHGGRHLGEALTARFDAQD